MARWMPTLGGAAWEDKASLFSELELGAELTSRAERGRPVAAMSRYGGFRPDAAAVYFLVTDTLLIDL